MVYIVIDDLVDYHNYKVIIRTAKCLDMRVVVVGNSVSKIKINKIASKESIQIDYKKTPEEFIKQYSKFPIICLEYSDDCKYKLFDSFIFPTVCCIVVGNEYKGISKKILNVATHIVTLNCRKKLVMKVAAVASIAQWKWFNQLPTFLQR